MICVLFFISLFVGFQSQVSVGVWPAVLRLWEAGDGHCSLGHHVFLHPERSLLHLAVLGLFVPQSPLQDGAVSGDGADPVSHTDLHTWSLPHLCCCAPPVATCIAVYCDTGTGESVTCAAAHFFIYCIFSVKSYFVSKCNRKKRLLVMTCARNTLYHR